MAPLRLLFLTQTYPHQEGETSGPFIRDLARGLVRGGDAVTVLAPRHPGAPEHTEDPHGVVVRTFPYAPRPFEVVGYSRSLDADEKLRGGSKAVAPLYALGAFRAARKLVRTQSFDLLQAHWVVPNGLAAAPLAGVGRPGRVPVAAGLHGSDVFLAEKPALRRWVRRALARMELVTGCSPELVDRVCALGFPQERARVIPYGVDVETFSPVADSKGAALWRRRLGIPPDAPVALSVGRMATKKGYQVLMEVLDPLLESHPELHLVLAGGGDRLEEFQAAAARWAGGTSSPRVHFPGVVYRDSLPDLYRAADLFVLPAVHDGAGNVDGLPNVILEAMASGLPVVATAISGIPLAVEDGVTGCLVAEKDSAALLEALRGVLANRDRARDLGAAGRAKAERSLTWEVIAGRYRSAYQESLAGTGARRAAGGSR